MKKILRNIFYIVFAVAFLNYCNNVIYTTEQCKSSKRGDTIYVKEFYIIEFWNITNLDLNNVEYNTSF